MQQSVCVVIKQPNDKVVCVSRKQRADNGDILWGLPGGKVDPGEGAEDAIIREAEEELGVQLDKTLLIPILSQACSADNNPVMYWVTTFLYNSPDYLQGPFISEDGIQVLNFTLHELSRNQYSPFASYNEAVMKVVKLWW